MNNKTCGECKYHKNNRCMLPCFTINHSAENSACHHFEVKAPPTNGDKIRQGGNRALKDVILGNCCYYCAFKTENDCCNRLNSKDCADGIEAWLNAPAESDVCVAQNAKNDTQTDLCCTDNTQDQETKE